MRDLAGQGRWIITRSLGRTVSPARSSTTSTWGKYPDVHLTVDFSRVLLWQIEDYLQREAADRALLLTCKPTGRFISPGLSIGEHRAKSRSPVDGFDVLIYTGSGLMGREITNIRSCDMVVIVGGALGELAIAYDEGRLIGVLTGTGGITGIVCPRLPDRARPEALVFLRRASRRGAREEEQLQGGMNHETTARFDDSDRASPGRGRPGHVAAARNAAGATAVGGRRHGRG